MSGYQFRFISSYRGEPDFAVWQPGREENRLNLRFDAAGPFLRMCGEPAPADIVAAFNEWRTAKHAADIAHMRARPDTYTLTPEIAEPPAPARGR